MTYERRLKLIIEWIDNNDFTISDFESVQFCNICGDAVENCWSNSTVTICDNCHAVGCSL